LETIIKALRSLSRTKIIATIALSTTGLLAGGLLVTNANATAESVAATTELSQASNFKHEQLDSYPVIAKAKADKRAEHTLNDANQVLAAVQNKVDATSLATSVASLSQYSTLSAYKVRALTTETETAAQQVQAAATEADRVAAEAAAQVAAAAAEAQAQAQAAANTPDGARATARAMAASRYGWGEGEFSCLNQLWNRESGWSVSALNAGSGATGIPQSLPGSKMASAGSDWATNASTQISWGLDYIKGSYGTPCAAWGHSEAMNWY
jgi:delta 1-pyrroline-5-carboxylate dehydrogenase